MSRKLATQYDPSDDFDKALIERANRNLGTVLFIFRVPRTPNAHDFPQPDLRMLPGFEFLDWGDKPEHEVNPKVFSQQSHVFMNTKERILTMGIIGPIPKVYEWAQEWLNRASSQKGPFKVWTKGAVWLNHEDILGMGMGPKAAEDSPDKSPVDLDDPDLLKKLASPTKLEEEYLLDNPHALWGDPEDDSDLGDKPHDPTDD